jgi:hypothetical protein
MPAEGIFIQWPDDAEPKPDALVARSQSDLSHHNVVALRPLKVYVFWASPLFLVPAENWHLHAASIAGRGRRFDPSSEGSLQWEHLSVASDGLTAFEFDSERTYVFIEVDFSKFYYLALYTKGAKAEGWISEDETELTKTLDALPKA